MNEFIKYIKTVLGIAITILPYGKTELQKLPSFLTDQYRFHRGELLGQALLIAEFLPQETLSPRQYAMHQKLLERFSGLPIVFVFHKMPSYNRARLSALGLNFVVPNTQIFIPSLMIATNKTTNITDIPHTLSPSAQVLLLHYFYNDLNDFSYNILQEPFGMPYPTVCRAIETLKKAGLCNVVGTRNKTVHFKENKQELFHQAVDFMKSPVTKTIYAELPPKQAVKSGMSALSAYSMINADEFEHLAISTETFKKLKDYSLEDRFLPIHIEVWSYDPALFANNGIADKISLYLSMKNDNDERVQHELNQIIHELW